LIPILFLQTGQAIPSSPMELVTNSTGATKIVLTILVILSLISWGIIFAKWYELRRGLRITYTYSHDFAGVPTLERAAQLASESGGPPATIMERACASSKRRRLLFTERRSDPPVSAAPR